MRKTFGPDDDDEYSSAAGVGEEDDGRAEEAEFDLPMPPALDASRPDVRAEIEGHALTNELEILRGFVGRGHTVDSTGDLELADAMALAERMGIDAWSRTAGSTESSPIESSADLAELQFRVELAEAAGAVEVEGATMSATDDWAALARIEAVTKVVRALLDKGPLTLATPRGAVVNHDIYALLEDSLPQLVALLWTLGDDTAPFDGLTAATVEACLEDLDYEAGTPALTAAPLQAEATFARLCDVLEIAGVVSRTGEQYGPRPGGGTKRIGGEIALTLLARAVVGEYLSDNGFVVPVAVEPSAEGG